MTPFENLINLLQTELDKQFCTACGNGHLNVVKYLLTSPTNPANIHFSNDLALQEACLHGHLEVVKYLLTSSELEEHAHINANSDIALKNACHRGHLDIVQYLLTSPALPTHSNLHADSESPLANAAAGGHVEIVRYLLTSPEIISLGYPNLHMQGDYLFKISCSQRLVLEYLIFEYNLPLTEDIASYIEGNEEITHLFQLRHLNQKLAENLSPKTSTKIKQKI